MLISAYRQISRNDIIFNAFHWPFLVVHMARLLEFPNIFNVDLKSETSVVTIGGYLIEKFEDIYPNGFQPNTADQFEIKFLNDRSTTFDLDIYFIGWRQQDTAGTIQKYYVVQSSIYFQLPDLNTPTMIGGPNDI